MTCENIIGNGQGGVGSAVDAVTGSLNTQRTDDPRFDDIPNTVLINATDIAVGTYYYPDANGVAQLGQRSLSIEGNVTSGSAGETLTLTLEGTNGYQWVDVIGPFIDELGISPITSPLVNVNNASDDFAASNDKFSFQKWRLKLVVSGTVTSNSANVASYQKAI